MHQNSIRSMSAIAQAADTSAAERRFCSNPESRWFRSTASFDRCVGASRRGQVCVQYQRRQTSYQGKSAAFLRVHCSNDKYSVHHESKSRDSGVLPQVGLYFYRLVMLRGKAVTTMQFKQPGVKVDRKSVCIPHVLSSSPSLSAPAASPHISRVGLTPNQLSR